MEKKLSKELVGKVVSDTNDKTIKVRTYRIKINDNLMTQLKSRKLLIPQEKISQLGYYKLLLLKILIWELSDLWLQKAGENQLQIVHNL